MAIFSTQNVTIKGISACVPKQEVWNKDYNWVSKKDRASIIKNVGVESRRFAPRGVTTSDLCFEAAEQLIKSLNWDKNDIELLIFVSQSRDYMVPSTSGILQDRLGLSHNCMSFDIGMGCSGWVYAMSAATSIMQVSGIKKALLLVGDISTINVSYRDKSTYPLFGDAGTATALAFDDEAKPIHYNLQSDGAGYDAIIMPHSGARHFISKSSFEYKKYEKGIYRNQFHLTLNGIDVFNFALREVVPNIKKTLKHIDKTTDDIDYFVFHQANKLINDTLRKLLKLEPEKTPSTLQHFGNTSSASIPLTIVVKLQQEVSTKKICVLANGFGVGLSWGSVVFELDNISCPHLIEY